MIIGSGMAGSAASLFAANRGLSTLQLGMKGNMHFSSGLMDLMGIHPVEEGRSWVDPWAAVDAVCTDIPAHPYARLEKNEIREGLGEFLSFLDESGLPYIGHETGNSRMITSAGTVKQTYRVPFSMWNGVTALQEKTPCLLVDFEGMRGFSSRQIALALKREWPGVRPLRSTLQLGDAGSRFDSPEIAALLMESEEILEALAHEIKPHTGDTFSVGMPAVLGFNRHREVMSFLEKELEVPLFEIPTIPDSIPGMRLDNAFSQGLGKTGLRRLCRHRILWGKAAGDGTLELGVRSIEGQTVIHARAVILATGRFLGGGLKAERNGIREPIFDLTVNQPATRNEWHRTDLFDLRGHPVNRAGLETDDILRPIKPSGSPHFENLFAAGSILAHHDWVRMKCGSGLAVATAFKAVKACKEILFGD